MKTRIIALFAGLLAVLPMTSAWAHSGTHYGKISVTASGEGTVYLSDSNDATSGSTSKEWNCGGTSNSSDSKTYYLYAVPKDENYGFVEWTQDGRRISTKQNCSVTATSTGTSTSPSENNYVANFAPYRQYRAKLICQATEGGKVAIGDGAYSDSEIVSPEQKCDKTLNDNASFNFAVHAQATGGWSFVRWKDANGKELSTTADYTHKVTSTKYGDDIEEVTIIAEFAQSHTYYAKTTVAVDGTCADGGVVALSNTDSSTGLEFAKSASISEDKTLADNAASFKYYAFAQCADDWWDFGGWYEGGKRVSADANTPFDVTTSSEDAGKPDGRSLTAKFVKAPLVTATCERSEGGSYTVSGTCSTKPTVTKDIAKGEGVEPVGLPRSLKITLSAATPATGYKFRRWWKLMDDGSKVLLSDSASVSVDIPTDGLTVGVDFIETGLNFAVGKSYFESFSDAVAAAQDTDGAAVSLVGDYEVVENVTIPSGVDLLVPPGTTLTVDEGVTLTVDGTLKVAGVIQNKGVISGSGVLARSYATVTQESEIHVPYPFGTDGKETGNGKIGTDGTAGKYVVSKSEKTDHGKSQFGTHDGVQSQWFVTVVTASGDVLCSSLTANEPIGVLCTVNRRKALNWIVTVGTAYEKLTVNGSAEMDPSFYPYQKYEDNEKIFVMVKDYTASSGSSNATYAYGAYDLAGHTLTFSDTKYNGTDVLKFFNGCGIIKHTGSGQKIMNIHTMFYNCYKIGSNTPKAASPSRAYTSGVSLYDSPDVSVSWTETQGEKKPFYGIYGGGTYSSVPSESFFKAYWGKFTAKNKPDASKLADSARFEWKSAGSDVWEVAKKVPDPNEKPAKIGDTKYDTLKAALDAATAGQTVVLQKDIELTEKLVVDATTDATLNLNGWVISGECAIENHGILEIVDDSGCVTPSELSASIVNKSGNLYLAAVTFSGAITVEGGKCDLLSGTYRGEIRVAGNLIQPQDHLEVTGGKYVRKTYLHGDEELQLVDLASHGHVREDGTFFHIGKTPQAWVGGSGQSFDLAAFEMLSPDIDIYKKTKSSMNRSSYTSRAEWLRAMEIDAGRDLVGSYSIDCTVVFDREVAAGTVSGSSMGMSIPLNEKVAAGEVKSVLLPGIRDTTLTKEKAPWPYGSFMPGGEHDSISFSVSSDYNMNYGTKCTLQMRYAPSVRWQAGGKKYDYVMEKSALAAERMFVIGAGDNKAMIRPETGAATFYRTLSDAIAAVETEGSVMLCNDCAETMTVGKACTIDANGFAFTGSIDPLKGFGVDNKGNGVFVVSETAKIEIDTTDDASSEKFSVEVTDEKLRELGVDTTAEPAAVLAQAVEKLNERDESGLKNWEVIAVEQEKAKESPTVVLAPVVETVKDGRKELTTGAKVENIDLSNVDYAKLPAGNYRKAYEVTDVNDKTVTIADTDKKEPTVTVVRNESQDKTIILPVPGTKHGDQEAKVSDVIDVGSLSDGDTVTYYDPKDGTKSEWKYEDGKWSDSETQKPDGSLAVVKPDLPLPVGGAFWLTRANPTKAVVIVAEVPKTVGQTVTRGEWSLAANPDPDPDKKVGIGDVVTDASDKDQVIIPTASGVQQTVKYDKTNGWTYKMTTIENGKIVVKRVPATVKGGQGFWYVSDKDAKVDAKIKWR